jgi:GntP family gluconate:H+ symporter
MNPIWLLLIGMVVVIGGVLLLRLHVFLAMILGALVVALATPQNAIYQSSVRTNAIAIKSIADDGMTFVLATKKVMTPGTRLSLVPITHPDFGASTLEVVSSNETETTARVIKMGVQYAKGPAPSLTDVVLEPAQDAAARSASTQSMGARVAEGFAATARDIAILIAMASIIGEALLISGSAERIVVACRRGLGDKRAPLAFLTSGFILGIPLFTVFYLLIPLAKVMRARSGRDYLLYILAIVAGATMTHSLVPPAPGPLFVASALKVNLVAMIAAGTIVSAFAAMGGYGYALWANRRWDIPLRDTMGAAAASHETVRDAEAGPEAVAALPPLWVALLPILLPVVLIAAGEIAELVKPGPDASPLVTDVLLPVAKVVGEKNLALTISVLVALAVVAYRKWDSKAVRQTVGDALTHGGVIILITAAGGAFGFVLRQTDIAASVREMVPAAKLSLIPLAWLAATLVRTAQGSATVAMITAAGIVAPLAAAGGLGYHPVYLACAIGCGSKPVMWMNDSGFWIIGKVSGLTEVEMLKSATIMMAIMGVVGLGVTMLAAIVLPLM